MRRINYYFVVLFVAALAIQSFKTHEDVGDEPLVVKRQQCVLQRVKHHVTNRLYDRSVAIDVPVRGNKVLVDSVITFLNKSLYKFFESNNEEHLAYDAVATTDARHLLSHYKKAYRKWYKNDRSYLSCDFLDVLMVAQTNEYVTYESDWSYWEEGIETYQEWTTFRKSDGRCLGEVISDKNLVRFLTEHPDKQDEVIWEDMQNKLKNDALNENVGLLNDSVVHQHVFAHGIYESTKYDLKTIMPYLSNEAQTLVRGN